MKKISKILMFILLLTSLCGCEIYVYDFGQTDNETSSPENLTQGGTGTTIVTDNVNYYGFINFISLVFLCNITTSLYFIKIHYVQYGRIIKRFI